MMAANLLNTKPFWKAEPASGFDSLRGEFATYLSHFGKSYPERSEYEHRFLTWRVRDEFIRDWNSKTDMNDADAHRVTHNQFSDWSREELERYLLFRREEDERKFLALEAEEVYLDPTDIPDSVDWVTKGAVNTPLSQGACRAAHTFSATASIEGAHFIKHGGSLLKLSEQQCVDCDKDSYGCNGGYAENCLWYAGGNVGLMLETAYPWVGKQQQICDADYSKKAASVKTVNSVKPKSAEQLKAAIAKGPVSITIDGSGYAFVHYFGGIITDPNCGTALSHEVVAVGYGVAKSAQGDDVPYYLIKNSWGKEWGEAGYVRIKMGGEDDWGICGTQEVGRYPDVV